MSFFIQTSKGMFNRDEIVRVTFWRNGIEVMMSDGYFFALAGQEAFLFIHTLIPTYTLGHPNHYEDFIKNHAPSLEDTASKVASTVGKQQEAKR